MTSVELQVLRTHLKKCREIIYLGSSDMNTRIEWLNNFCGDFYIFTNHLHKFITSEIKEDDLEGNEIMDNIFLCLAQVCLCTKYLERIIRAEDTARNAIPNSRKHFIDRIMLCFDKLEKSFSNLSNATENKSQMSGYGFITLLDIAMDHIKEYSTYQEDMNTDTDELNQLEDALETSQDIYQAVRLMISHALALANVALIQDKTAISALCQKVLRESTAFQRECENNLKLIRTNNWHRRIKAIALGTSLTQLHQYIDGTVLRLIFLCFADLEKFSLDKLRAKLRQTRADDTELDEFIADFDVNLDRLAQIGHFAVSDCLKPKLKTLVRSCMASLEALDSCIIPSLKAYNGTDMHTEILEQHFYEEINKFKTVLYEIVDAQPITRCFYELFNSCLAATEKQFNKSKLDDLVQMGEFLFQYFQYSANKKKLQQSPTFKNNALELLQKYKLMLNECRAISVCADQVNHVRIMKRFKILRAILRRFVDALEPSENVSVKRVDGNLTVIPNTATGVQTIDLNASQYILDSIEPSICSILYRNETDEFTPRRRAATDSMRANYSKCPLFQNDQALSHAKLNDGGQSQFRQCRRSSAGCSGAGSSMRRKESLRTVMFKRQKSAETQKVCNFYLQNSASLQISEILDQLSEISGSSPSAKEEHLLNTSIME
ncbi:PREDICTED: serendipity locus protein alpha [Bactrocera latifrons]|uniref:serendipity locus protein alpha n=1 Tax=Bactrocera latifrons TaxID=174628 RepID=UPI0008DD6D20|nr:PREDICTED: serendipity locus protein alpha [Bactrocera latifrons]